MLEEPWSVTLLGRLSAEKRSATIARFRTQQTGALLARLALWPRRMHTREELADLLWPDDDPDAARAKLRIALSSLRRQMEPPGAGRGSVLQADRAAVCLNPDAVTTDVACFEDALARAERAGTPEDRQKHLLRARALYAGELLPGHYDDWVVDERERLEALWEQARGSIATLPAPSAPDDADPMAPRPPADAAPPAHVHLPPQWTRFFGRNAEREQIRAWLAPPGGGPGARLVTLTGPGGVGKTRLSLEAARSLAPSFAQGVYFIALADAREAARLLPLIAARLAPADALPEDPRRFVVEQLAGAPALLVLDNLEQMTADIGPRIQHLLAQVPTLRCLATSRHVLNVPGEAALPLAPLPVPGEAAPVTLAEPSVALFVDRARQHRPDFGLTAGNADAVGRLCARLDGLPLALELASAWIGVLTPAQMLDRLQEQARSLGSRRKDVPERHQTLRAAVAWSFDLLPAGLRAVWAQLSVFRGGWTAEAMAEVCQTEDGIEAIARLQDRSLVIAELTEDGAAVRYRMLESLREFAQDQMTPEQWDAAARRHAAYFLQFASDADDRYYGPEQAGSLNLMEADHDNIRAATDRYADDPEGGSDGLLLAANLQRFWWLRGYFDEGRTRSAQALSHPDAPRDNWPRARVLLGVNILARLQGDNDEAERLCLECLEIVRPLGKPGALTSILGNLGHIAKNRGDLAAARDYYEQCLDGARAADLDRVSATALVNLGTIAELRADWDEARRYYDESLTLMRGLDNAQGVLVALNNLGLLDTRTGDFPAAHRDLDECLTLCLELMDKSGLAYALEARAQLALAEREFPLTATLYAAAAALRRTLGTPLPAPERVHFDRDQAALRDILGPAYDDACRTGDRLSLEAAVSLALAEKPASMPAPNLAK